MEKPNGYDDVQAFGIFENVELGGHVCQVIKVEETQSKNGKDMLKIYLDIAEGKQKGYYTKRYKSDTRANKRWPCVVNQVVLDKEGMCSGGLKAFLENIEKSNPGFSIVWGNEFCATLKGKKIGGVFGREEYYDENAQKTKFATKCVRFCTIEEAPNMEPPEDKFLPESQRPRLNRQFEDISAIDEDDDLPFI